MQSEASFESTPTPVRRHRILVLEDRIDVADSLAMLLEALGQEVRIAYDGPGALELAPVFRPDIAILDIGIPGIGGIEVARHLRNSIDGTRVKLAALTGLDLSDGERQALQRIFDFQFVKPISERLLRELLRAKLN